MQQPSLHFRQIKHPWVRGSHLQLTSRRAQIIRCSVCTCFSVPSWLNQICYGKCALTFFLFHSEGKSSSHLLYIMQIWLTSRGCWISKTWNRPENPVVWGWILQLYHASSDINRHLCIFTPPAFDEPPFKSISVLWMHFRKRSLRHNWIDFCVAGRRAE